MHNTPHRHSSVGWNPFFLFYNIPIFVVMTLLIFLFTSPLHAEDKEVTLDDIISESTLEEGSVRYSPEGCGFEMIFPSKPYKAKRCPNGPKSCTNLTSYTMVYDVTTTIEVSVTCVPSTPEKYKAYTEPVIATALKGMVERGNITDHEIITREEDDMRQGSLLGSATRGKQNSIYNAQLWVGQNSVMTVESKLIGPYHAEADQVFSEILESIKKL